MHRKPRTLSRRVVLTLSASAATLAAFLSVSPARAQSAHAPARHLSLALVGQTANEFYNQGVMAFQQNKYDEAITAFTNAIKKRTGSPYADAYFGRGLAYNRKKEYAKAAADFDEALKVKPNLGDAYVERAVANAGLSKFPAAIADFTAAEQKGANRNSVLLQRAIVYIQMKEWDNGIKDLSEHIKNTPNAPAPVHYNLGICYLEKKQFAPAIDAFSSALKTQPNYALALSGRAEAYLEMTPADHAKAAADAEAALKADPNDDYPAGIAARAYAALEQAEKLDDLARRFPKNPDVLIMGAGLDLKKGRSKQAIEKYVPLIARFPENTGIRFNLALAYLNDKQYGNAVTAYDGFLKLDQKNPTAYHNRGVANFYLDKSDAAVADFDQAIKLDPKYYDAYVNKVRAAFKLAVAGKKDAYTMAIDAATAAIAIKDTPEVRYQRGSAYYNMEQWAKAIPDMEIFRKAKPTDPEVGGLMANAMIRLGKLPEAAAILEEECKKFPKDGRNFQDLGKVYMDLKEYQKAIAPLTQCIAITPADTDVKYNRGLCHFNLKNWQGAKTEMDAVLAAAPKNAPEILVRADALFNLKQFKPAIADYAAYLTTTPPPAAKDKEYAQKGMVDAAAQSGDPKLVIDVCNGVLKESPDNSEILTMRGVAYIQSKQFDLAKADLEKAIAKKPEDANLWFNMGLCYRELKDVPKEAAAFEKSATIKPDYAAGSNAGVAYTKLATPELIDSDPKKATEYLDKAIAMFDAAVKGANVKPDSAAIAYFNKAVAYEKKAEATQEDSHLKGAVDAYAKYLELKPAAEDKAQVQEAIKAHKSKLGIN